MVDFVEICNVWQVSIVCPKMAMSFLDIIRGTKSTKTGPEEVDLEVTMNAVTCRYDVLQ